MNILNNKVLRIYLVFLLILIQLFFPNQKSYAESKTSQEVFAVVDFSNDTGDSSKDYLQKGLANTLITSLGSYSNDMISIVERGQLTSLIKEMGLSSSGIVDSSNAVKLGNALGATQIIVGGLVRAGSILRLNIRVINVKTSRLTLAMSEDGRSEEELLRLVDNVAEKIVNKINNTEKVSDTMIKPFEENFDALKEIKKIDEKKEAPPETVNKDDNTWLWITGGLVAVLAIVIIVVISKSSSGQGPVIEPARPTALPTVYEPGGGAPVITPIPGGTGDFTYNLKF